MADAALEMERTPAEHDMLAAALNYARAGIAVFPLHTPRPGGLCSCGHDHGGNPKTVGKHPRTRNGVKDATTEEARIEAWWTAAPDGNIGIPCGPRNAIFVFDVDGQAGQESLRRLTDQFGPLPATRKVNTGNGYQLYFQHPDAPIRNRAPVNPDFPGLDSRGNGGYVVAAPSLHYTGRRYSIDTASPTQIAPAPKWLIDFIERGPQRPSGSRARQADNDRAIAEGGRNTTLTGMAGSMRRTGATKAELEAALLIFNATRCDPPLDHEEVLGIARSVAKYAPAPDDLRRTLTDAGNADRFADRHRDDVRFVPERGVWLVWRGTHWQADAIGEVAEMAKRVAAAIFEEGMLISDDAFESTSRGTPRTPPNAARLKAMVELAVPSWARRSWSPSWIAIVDGSQSGTAR